MSRSHRKTPIFKCCSGCSDKPDKIIANKRLRIRQKQALKKGGEIPILKEVSSVWNFVSDGKVYRKDTVKKDMRK